MAPLVVDSKPVIPRRDIVFSHLQFAMSLGTLGTFSLKLAGGAERTQILGGMAVAGIAALIKMAGFMGARDQR